MIVNTHKTYTYISPHIQSVCFNFLKRTVVVCTVDKRSIGENRTMVYVARKEYRYIWTYKKKKKMKMSVSVCWLLLPYLFPPSKYIYKRSRSISVYIYLWNGFIESFACVYLRYLYIERISIDIHTHQTIYLSWYKYV